MCRSPTDRPVVRRSCHAFLRSSPSAAVGTEKDFYKITARASATITATVTGGRRVRILSSSGALLNGGIGSATWNPGLILGTATYYIEVRANGVVGNYTLTMTAN